MKVVLASTSDLKTYALALALRRLGALALRRLGVAPEVVNLDAESGVSLQPYGNRQTLEGALNRAQHALRHYPQTYVVAVENGVVSGYAGFEDLAYVVVLDPLGRVTVRRSAAVAVPTELVEQSEKSGWALTVGLLEARRSPDCYYADPHTFWSGGRTSRMDLLSDTITEALSAAVKDN